jgi:hypothetical protein
MYSYLSSHSSTTTWRVHTTFFLKHITYIWRPHMDLTKRGKPHNTPLMSFEAWDCHHKTDFNNHTQTQKWLWPSTMPSESSLQHVSHCVYAFCITDERVRKNGLPGSEGIMQHCAAIFAPTSRRWLQGLCSPAHPCLQMQLLIGICHCSISQAFTVHAMHS